VADDDRSAEVGERGPLGERSPASVIVQARNRRRGPCGIVAARRAPSVQTGLPILSTFLSTSTKNGADLLYL
jgi:hypothetical protein